MSKETIRQLTATDAKAFCAFRHQALKESDDPASAAHLCFAVSHAEEADKTEEYYLPWFSRNIIFGILQNKELTGMATFSRLERVRQQHRGELGGMYLQPSLRGTGVADRFLQYIIDFALGEGIEQIELCVMEPNERARAFYRKHGFTDKSINQNGLKIGDRYYNDIGMVKIIASNVIHPHKVELVLK
jgi:RimJ/RimL family protein N-acetyltransferase